MYDVLISWDGHTWLPAAETKPTEEQALDTAQVLASAWEDSGEPHPHFDVVPARVAVAA